MNEKEFILEVIKAYQNARKPKYLHEKLRRGRSHKIDSITEDILAYYLISNDETIDQVYIDQPLSIVGVKGTKYPDIVIVRNGIINDFVDVKMDLGWVRDKLYVFCKKYREMVIQWRDANCCLKDGLTKNLHNLKISKNAKYSIIIISETNISSVILYTQLKQARTLYPDVDVFVLSSKKHLNTYGKEAKEVLSDLDINYDEFERLSKRLKIKKITIS